MRRLALIAGLALLGPAEAAADSAAERFPTATAVKDLVVLYVENASSDSCFGLSSGLEPGRRAAVSRPARHAAVNGLTSTLLEHNSNRSNPFSDRPPGQLHLRFEPPVSRRTAGA